MWVGIPERGTGTKKKNGFLRYNIAQETNGPGWTGNQPERRNSSLLGEVGRKGPNQTEGHGSEPGTLITTFLKQGRDETPV